MNAKKRDYLHDREKLKDLVIKLESNKENAIQSIYSTETKLVNKRKYTCYEFY